MLQNEPQLPYSSSTLYYKNIKQENKYEIRYIILYIIYIKQYTFEIARKIYKYVITFKNGCICSKK